MTTSLSRFIGRLAIAPAAVALLFGLRLLIAPAASLDTSFVFMIAAVALAAWYGGDVAGVLATLLGGVLGACSPLLAGHPWLIPGIGIRLGLFLAEALFICGILHRLRAARQRADEHAAAWGEAKERQRFALGAAHVVTWEWDITTGAISYDECVQETRGRSALSSGSTFAKFLESVHPEDRERIRTTAWRAVEGRSSYHVEFRLLWPDGTLHWTESRARVHCDELGFARRMVGISVDMTEHKRAEARLQESDERFRQLAENIQGVFWMTNPATSEMLYISPAYENIWGRTCEELYTRPMAFIEAIHPEDREGFMADLKQKSAGDLMDTQYRIVRPDGTIRWIWDRGFPIKDESGQVYRIAGIAEDITQRKQVEAELCEAMERAESANRAKSEFLANMSHEIRTPMNGILGMTELALETEVYPETREYLELVKTSADALLHLLNDILDFSKIEARKLELATAAFPLRESVDATLKPLALRARQKGLALSAHVAPDVPGVLLGDVGRLRQVLVNLVGNAIKFTDHGEITIQVEREPAAAGRPSTSVDDGDGRPTETAADSSERSITLRFTVGDTGIGVPMEKQARIFNAFEQADGSMTRRYGGTGLGLTICSRLVSLMGGRIWLESSAGTGATFHFTVCCGIASEAGAAPGLTPAALRLPEPRPESPELFRAISSLVPAEPTLLAVEPTLLAV